jgi:arginine/lysine/ornithine decarboxylase
MISTPVHDFLAAYSAKNPARCHTPGGKGLCFPHDITEICGADSLYNADGIIAESERTAASLFGSLKTLYSCSGSTLAIQAMLTLVKTASRGNKIAAFRYAHRSFVSAAALLGFEVDWIYPGEFMSADIKPEAVKAALTPETSAVFINSLDYYGGGCDVQSVAKVCKSANIPLLVDNAHGAYLALTEKHPIKLGAAMTADSAHKTLPALTGAAYLHINDPRFTEGAKAATALFGTSSPSYLVLESLDLCNKHLSEAGTEAFELVAELKRRLSDAGLSLRGSDLLRVTVNAREYGYSGIDFAAALRKNNAECEYADENCTVLLFSTITSKPDTDAVFAAFGGVARRPALEPRVYSVLKPERAMSVRDALFAPDADCAYTSPAEAAGRVCAEIQTPCPPGVPLIMPGERICGEAARLLAHFGVKKVRTTN